MTQLTVGLGVSEAAYDFYDSLWELRNLFSDKKTESWYDLLDEWESVFRLVNRYRNQYKSSIYSLTHLSCPNLPLYVVFKRTFENLP